MGWGLTACLLIRLDARLSEWVPLDDLVAHLACDAAAVRAEIEQLASHDLLSVRRNVTTGEVTHACVDPLLHKGLTR